MNPTSRSTRPAVAFDAKKNFVRQFAAQLEARKPTNESELATCVVVARTRTEELLGTPLSDADLALFVKESAAHGAEQHAKNGLGVSLRDYVKADQLVKTLSAATRRAQTDLRAGLSELRRGLPAIRSPKEQIDGLMRFVATPEQRETLIAHLDAEPFDAAALVAGFGTALSARDVWQEWAGTWESYSVGSHTEAVLTHMDAFMDKRPLAAGALPDTINLKRTMRFMVLMHDVGKAAAIAAGNKADQHAFTVPVLVHLAQQCGFQENEVALMRALVDNDVIGKVINPYVNRDVNEGAEELMLLAREVGVSPTAYFALQAMFYSADAYAYPDLREQVFGSTPSDPPEPCTPQFAALRARVAALESLAV